jgi:hypothetical protein
MEIDDDVNECAVAMIRRHARRSAEVAQRLADLHFLLDEPEMGAFWSALALVLRQKLGLLS